MKNSNVMRLTVRFIVLSILILGIVGLGAWRIRGSIYNKSLKLCNTSYGYSGATVHCDLNERVDLFVDGNRCYLFLPSYVSDIWAKVAEVEAKYIAGAEYELVVMKSSQIPTIQITTETGTIENVNADKEYLERGRLSAIDIDGTSLGNDDMSIRGHGYSSFYDTNNKSYTIRFDEMVPLLGMSKARKWILISNAYDPTQIRNKVTYELYKWMGEPYTIDTEYADVYINNQYAGCYLVCPQIEVREGRVEEENGVLLKIDRPDEDDTVIEDKYGHQYIVKYPDEMKDEERNTLSSNLSKIYDIANYIGESDSLDELAEYVDVSSLVDEYIINMFTQESDANCYSTYMCVSGEDGLIRMGPPWDFDRAYGKDVRVVDVRMNAYYSGIPERLFYHNEVFRDMVCTRFDELVEKGIESQLEAYMDYYVSLIWDSISMDRVVHLPDVDERMLEPDVEGYVHRMREYVHDTCELMDDTIHNYEDYLRVMVGDEYGRRLWVKRGDSITQYEIDLICDIYSVEHIYVNDEELFAGYIFADDSIISTTQGNR